MGWLIRIPAVPVEEFAAAVDKARQDADIPSQNAGTEEQVDLAVKLVKEIAASGVLAANVPFLMGHIEGHRMWGYGYDALTISVHQSGPPRWLDADPCSI